MTRMPLMEGLESRQLMSVALAGLGVYRSAPAAGSHVVAKAPAKKVTVVKKVTVKPAATNGRGTTTAGIISGTVYYDINENGRFDPLIDLTNGGGKVFADLNNNGILDVGEPNVVVSETGAYSFGGLQAGSYTIREVPPVGFAELAPAALAYHVVLSTGQTLGSRDFFNVPAATVTGVVFADLNNDGQQEPGESGLAGQKLFADLNNNGILDVGEPTAISDSRGGYTLTGLAPGATNIRLVVQSNFRAVSPGAGVLSTQLVAGQTINVDFGEIRIF